VKTESLLFGGTLLLYLFAAVAYHLHLFTGSEKARRAGTFLTVGGAMLHFAAIGVWCVEHRGESILRDPGMPFSLVAFFVAAVQGVLGIRSKWASLGSLTMPLAFVMQFYSATVRRQTALKAEEAGRLLNPHVLAILLAFAAFTLAFCLAVLYLGQANLLKRKQLGGVFSRLPPLESVGNAAHWLAAVGFSMLTLGIITGVIAAPERWGPGWYLDARILTSLVAWVVYAAYLGASMFLGWRGRRTTYFLIAGFLVVLIAFLANVARPKSGDQGDTMGGVSSKTLTKQSRSMS
jgi:ABC-type uncharacterized transport system permease subunit